MSDRQTDTGCACSEGCEQGAQGDSGLCEECQAEGCQHELVDLTGIARMRGVSRQRAQQLTQHPAFPAPLPVDGGQRKVWDRTAVQDFLDTERKPGRPPVSR